MENVTRTWGDRELCIEVDKVARQADGAVLIHYGDTVVLVTAVAAREPREGGDFFPLTVNYVEMTYAAGRIPGGFFKREGRPTDQEVLSSRVIDRTIRPLFPKGFLHETQVIATVLSADQQADPAIIGIVGASTALHLSDIPFMGPVAGVKVGRIDGQLIVNPSREELARSDLELVVAGNREGVVMVEGGATIVDESVMSEAIFFGYESLQPILDLQDELRVAQGKDKRPFVPSLTETGDLWDEMQGYAAPLMNEAFRIRDKIARRDRIQEIFKDAVERFGGPEGEQKNLVARAIDKVERDLVRGPIFRDNVRIDGRKVDEVRPLVAEVSLLPRTHGSALFSRGETQVLAVTTLGTSEDEKKVESLMAGETYKTFMLHYNFPPYSVGETAFLRSPGRREIGHGVLAERALLPVLPSSTEFPYTIRVVSEVLESNGSSSMATVCGSCMSLMDAGVPIKAAVAGVAMGLMKEKDQVAILTDIAGEEDHNGDMDFKIAGTREGLTALQMDVKVPGLTREIMERALAQAKEARLRVLDFMGEVLPQPRTELSRHAPRIVTIRINPDRIRDVIGPLGKNIKAIVEKTGVKINIEDDGTVELASSSAQALEEAIDLVRQSAPEAEQGAIYTGKVKKIVDFGAFVEILPGVEGLLHISEVSHSRIRSVSDVLKVGEEVQVKVLTIDDNGKIRLSRRAVLGEGEEGGNDEGDGRRRDHHDRERRRRY